MIYKGKNSKTKQTIGTSSTQSKVLTWTMLQNILKDGNVANLDSTKFTFRTVHCGTSSGNQLRKQCTVPGKSKTSLSNTSMSSSGQRSASSSSSNLSSLQNMGMSSKDMLECSSSQTDILEAAADNYTTEKYIPNDVKVNKWLSDLSDQISMEYGASSSSNSTGRRSNRQNATVQQQQQQQISQIPKTPSQSPQLNQQLASAGRQGLIGEEPVPVLNKQTSKRLKTTNNGKAVSLNRLQQQRFFYQQKQKAPLSTHVQNYIVEDRQPPDSTSTNTHLSENIGWLSYLNTANQQYLYIASACSNIPATSSPVRDQVKCNGITKQA